MAGIVYMISDLHLGHRNILDFARPQFSNLNEMHEYIIDTWNDTVRGKKRDVVWGLGDVAFSKECLPILNKLNGYKKLVLGNHDKFSVKEYAKYFGKIFGGVFLDGGLLTHIPCHPQNIEFRAKFNVHGHIHDPKQCIRDSRYVNVCMDCVPHMAPVPWEEIKNQQAITRLTGG